MWPSFHGRTRSLLLTRWISRPSPQWGERSARRSSGWDMRERQPRARFEAPGRRAVGANSELQRECQSRHQGRRFFLGGGGGESRHECAFFDVRVFYPHARSHRRRSLRQIYRSQEQEKRRQYEERILNVERGTFTPLVFSATGGAGPAATAFLKRLADKYSSRKSSSYAQTLNWIRCRLSFALLRSGILCLRGARTVRPANSASELRQPDLAVVEARLE